MTLAHAYGDLTRSQQCCSYRNIQDVTNSANNCRYYCRRDRHKQEFAYRFNEYNRNDISKAYPRFTNRTITASSGKCLNYTQDEAPKELGDGYISVKYYNENSNGTIKIPKQSHAIKGTTYIFRGNYTPQNALHQRCDRDEPRCMVVRAHRSLGLHEPRQVYQCPITVSNVTNVKDSTQDISHPMARLAATSIALQGRRNEDNSWRQYQLYTFR